MKTDEATVLALSYVGQIMKAYKAAEQAGASALQHALECGKHLNDAHETVGKSKWTGWRKVNIPETSQETTSVYMRLAKAIEEQPDVFEGCTSIRAAIKKLPNKRPRKESKGAGADAGDADSAENSSGATNSAAQSGPASDDLVTLLKNVGPDEIVKALKQADWQREEVEKLVTLLNTALAAPPAPAQPTPPLKRRPLLGLGGN